MIAASHQKQFQLYGRPTRLAGRDGGESVKVLAGTNSHVVDAFNPLSVGHAVLSPLGVDAQSTTDGTPCGATSIPFRSNPRAE